MSGRGKVGRAATVLVYCLGCVACSTAPAAPVPPSAAAPRGATTASAMASTGGLSLPDGVVLPQGVVLVGPAPHRLRRGQYIEWRATYALRTVSESDVLDAVPSSLTPRGWTVERGPHDAFATRCAAGRCELLIARTARAGAGAGSEMQVTLLFASRPA
jgi:hypothetical protein